MIQSTGIKQLMDAADHEGLRQLLAANPALANEGIPFDEKNTTKAHPLHRLCDGVFAHRYTDEQGVELAKIFLEYGADVNGGGPVEPGRDTPLLAAASLHAEQVGLLYIERGADIHHAGCHGGTALHWAAWIGRDKLVERLIREGAEINRRCTDFRGTPLLWAVHGYKFAGEKNRHHQIACVQLLLEAGADKTVPNIEGTPAIGFLEEGDEELRDLLR